MTSASKRVTSDLLEQLTEDRVVLSLAGPRKAAVVRGPGFIGLLMPIRP